MKPPQYDLRPCQLSDVRELCERFHGYGSAGNTAVYTFGVYESGRIVAAYAWQPPPAGAAKSVCPRAPWGVLALSRMVAVPKAERALNHVSKPLRRQMRVLIDRSRWPSLVTYSDEGQGHTGHVYKCSGWTPTKRTKRETWTDDNGRRISTYCAGKHRSKEGLTKGWTFIQRWEHHEVNPDEVWQYMQQHGWRRVPTGRVWRSGKPAYTITKEPTREA